MRAVMELSEVLIYIKLGTHTVTCMQMYALLVH